MRRFLPIAACGLLLTAPAFAPSDADSSEAAARLLLGETFPIETSVSFPAALLHWLDSLAGLSGPGLTAGKTIEAHRTEYNRKLGRPTVEDQNVLLDYAEVRRRSVNGNHDPNSLAIAFFEAGGWEEALNGSRQLLGTDDAKRLAATLSHFAPRYRRIWNQGRIPHLFLERVGEDRRRTQVSDFLVDVARFLDVSALTEPHPKLVLVPVIRGRGTHAQALGRHLLIELRPGEGLREEVAPIVHENVHLLYSRIDPERKRRFGGTARGLGAEEAFDSLREALPTAIAQGVADQRFGRGGWSFDLNWYHIPEIDEHAKRIYPLVKKALAEGAILDEALFKRMLGEYGTDL